MLVFTYRHVDTAWHVLSQTLLQSVCEPNFQTTAVISYTVCGKDFFCSQRRLTLYRHMRRLPSGESAYPYDALKVTANTLSGTVTDLYWRRKPESSNFQQVSADCHLCCICGLTAYLQITADPGPRTNRSARPHTTAAIVKVVGACDHMFDLRLPTWSFRQGHRKVMPLCKDLSYTHTGCVVKYLTDHHYSAARREGLYYDARVMTGQRVYVRVCGRIKQHLVYSIERITT